MTVLEMLGQSAVLAVLGIGIVSGFFLVLIALISLMGKIVNKNAASSPSDFSGNIPEKNPIAPAAAGKDSNDKVIAAISAAVSEYRKSH